MKKRIFFKFKIGTLIILLFLITSCARSFHQAIDSSPRKEITILATSDFHGSVDRSEAFANTILDLRQKHKSNTFHFDGGDLFQGQIETNLNKGRPVVELYNLIGVDAVAIGNHELDYGPDVPKRNEPHRGEDSIGNLRKMVRLANFPWLSSNFIYKNKTNSKFKNALNQSTVFRPRTIIERNGIRVCAIGATTPVTKNITRRSFITGLDFGELYSTVFAEAKLLRQNENCDFVILISHAGLECDRKHPELGCRHNGPHADILRLLNQLPKGTLDAVVGGHTHMQAFEVINETPVIVGGSYGQVVGVLHLVKKNNKLEFNVEPFVTVPEKSDNSFVSALLLKYRQAAEKIKSEPVGISKEIFQRIYSEENAIVNLVSDAIFEKINSLTPVDFVAINAGGVRTSLPRGNLNYGDIYRPLPFDDGLAVVKLKGSDFRRFIEVLQSGAHGRGGVSSQLKLKMISDQSLELKKYDKKTVERDLNSDGIKEAWEMNRIIDIIDQKTGRPIHSNKTYSIATLSYLSSGGDHQSTLFDNIKPKVKEFPEIPSREALKFYLKRHSPVDPNDYFKETNRRIELIN